MEKNEFLGHYEMLYIIPNKFTEEEAGVIAKKTESAVSAVGGSVTHTEIWGKKRLAYPISQNNYGYYNLVEFDLAKEKVVELDKTFRMDNEILRHLIVKKEVKTAEDLAKEKAIAEKIAAKGIAAKEKEAKDVEEEKKEQKQKDKKMDLKDLDEKLDKILDTEDLL